MLTAEQWVDILGPQYAGDSRLPTAILGAREEIPATHPYYEKAVALLALHMLALADRGGSGGAVASQTEGSLSQSYMNSGKTDGLSSTSFGQELLRLHRLSVGFGAMTQVKRP